MGPVLVIGTGLLGTSVGLALGSAGVPVRLSDHNAEHVQTAVGLGAGLPFGPDDAIELVVVAVPPDQLGEVVAAALREHPQAAVTDVGSVKVAPLQAVAALVPDLLPRYVGGHPMAGSERSGPLASSATLFEGRPWAITAHPTSTPAAVAAVRGLVDCCGAVAVEMTPAEHDAAVARTSHLPHLMSVLTARRLLDAPQGQLNLAGQGLRDVTRIAGSDPVLWQQILAGNSAPVADLLEQVRDDLDRLLAAVRGQDRAATGDLLARAVQGTRAIPGKHGGADRPVRSVFVAIADSPGELARLFAAAGEHRVNIEDVRIDHDLGRAVGVLELIVPAEDADRLHSALRALGWPTHR